jgi:heptosyltransferase-2
MEQKKIRILVIRFSSIGDIVLTTPVLRCLRTQLPEAEIHFLTRWRFREVSSHNPNIDHFHYLNQEIVELVPELKDQLFDHVVDLQNNRKSRVLRNMLKVKSTVVNKLNIRKFLLTSFKVNLLPDKHIVQRYLETVKELGVHDDGKGLDHFISAQDQVPQSDIPTSHSLGYIAFVIGATYYTKRLPAEKWIELCRQVDHPIMLLGGPGDRKMGEEIAALDPIRIYNACGKFSLNESACLIEKSKLVVSHDTGLMHIAAAYQKPVIAVWGNTVPRFGMYPYYGSRSGKTAINAEVKGLWCRPCSKLGYDRCPLGHFKCMKKQDIQELARTLYQQLSTVKF